MIVWLLRFPFSHGSLTFFYFFLEFCFPFLLLLDRRFFFRTLIVECGFRFFRYRVAMDCRLQWPVGSRIDSIGLAVWYGVLISVGLLGAVIQIWRFILMFTITASPFRKSWCCGIPRRKQSCRAPRSPIMNFSTLTPDLFNSLAREPFFN